MPGVQECGPQHQESRSPGAQASRLQSGPGVQEAGGNCSQGIQESRNAGEAGAVSWAATSGQPDKDWYSTEWPAAGWPRQWQNWHWGSEAEPQGNQTPQASSSDAQLRNLDAMFPVWKPSGFQKETCPSIPSLPPQANSNRASPNLSVVRYPKAAVSFMESAYATWTWSRGQTHIYGPDFTPKSLFPPDSRVSWWVQSKHQYFVALIHKDNNQYDYYKICGEPWVTTDGWEFYPSKADKTSLFQWWQRPEGDSEGYMKLPGPAGQELTVKTVMLAQPPAGGHGQALILCLMGEPNFHYGSCYEVTLVRCSRVPANVKQALLHRVGHPIHFGN